MWECPQCGRSFGNPNQSHFCGEKPKTIDEYISMQPEKIRPCLAAVRTGLYSALPEAEERISWSMPTYWKGHNIIHFAAHKKHLGLYAGTEAVQAFRERLGGYKTSKGAIQFPYAKPIPLDLIAEIAKWCWQTGNYP